MKWIYNHEFETSIFEKTKFRLNPRVLQAFVYVIQTVRACFTAKLYEIDYIISECFYKLSSLLYFSTIKNVCLLKCLKMNWITQVEELETLKLIFRPHLSKLCCIKTGPEKSIKRDWFQGQIWIWIEREYQGSNIIVIIDFWALPFWAIFVA